MRFPPGSKPLATLALALLALAPAVSRASITFLGAAGGASSSRTAVSWMRHDNGLPDSIVSTFAVPAGHVLTDSLVMSHAEWNDPDGSLTLVAQSAASVAAAGPADSTRVLADCSAYLIVVSLAGELPFSARTSFNLALLYHADVPTIWWVARGVPTGIPNGYPGPPPSISTTGLDIPAWQAFVKGSVPNTGELDLGAVMDEVLASGGSAQWIGNWGFRISLSDVDVLSVPESEPWALALAAPRPNPAPGVAAFEFTLPAAATARIDIVDVAGRRVRTLADGTLPAGTTRLRWDGGTERGTRAEAGVYWVRLVSAGRVLARRFVLLP